MMKNAKRFRNNLQGLKYCQATSAWEKFNLELAIFLAKSRMKTKNRLLPRSTDNSKRGGHLPYKATSAPRQEELARAFTSDTSAWHENLTINHFVQCKTLTPNKSQMLYEYINCFKKSGHQIWMWTTDEIKECLNFFENLIPKIEEMLRNNILVVCSYGILPQQVVQQQAEQKALKKKQ